MFCQTITAPRNNDIEFSGERKRVRSNEGLGITGTLRSYCSLKGHK